MSDPEAEFDAMWELFAEAADEKYEGGVEKYGYAWHDADPEYLCRRMEEEFYEFRQAVEHYQDPEAAAEELGDFVNFALMYLIRFNMEEE